MVKIKSAHQPILTRTSRQKLISTSLGKKQTFAAPPVTHFFFCLTLCVIDRFRATLHHLSGWNPGAVPAPSRHTYTHIQPFLSAWPACVLSPPSGGFRSSRESIAKPTNPSIELENHRNGVTSFSHDADDIIYLSASRFCPPRLITQPVHALLHLPIYTSACMHERVAFLARVSDLICTHACMCASYEISVKVFIQQNPSVMPSVTSDPLLPVNINDRASHPLPPTKWECWFITAGWQTQRKGETRRGM